VEGLAEQFVEPGFPGPVAGQVQHEPSGGAGDPSGHGDQLGVRGCVLGLGRGVRRGIGCVRLVDRGFGCPGRR